MFGKKEKLIKTLRNRLDEVEDVIREYLRWSPDENDVPFLYPPVTCLENRTKRIKEKSKKAIETKELREKTIALLNEFGLLSVSPKTKETSDGCKFHSSAK